MGWFNKNKAEYSPGIDKGTATTTPTDSSSPNGTSPENMDTGDPPTPTCASAWLSDWRSISLLLFLYALQGLPLGLIGSIPLIIQSRNVTYSEQAKFSLAYWPFSLKLLWAPLVDALYFRRFGRRKSWLIPTQYLICLTMLYLSYQVDNLLDTLQIGMLTLLFFFLNFLTATQDVAVDGWALTMLRRENVGLASTCNAVGQSFGAFIGYAVFLNLASAEFSNKWLRSEPKDVGVVTLSSFMFIWSCIYAVATTLILVFKKEEETKVEEEETGWKAILSSYLRLWWVFKLPSVRKCILFTFTSGLGFAAVSALSDLKLVEAGLKKEVRALMSVPLTPISLLVPILVSKWTAGIKPMSLFMKAYVFALLMSGVIAAMVWVTGEVKYADGGFPGWYIPTLIGIECIFRIFSTTMFVAKMAFVAKISDPAHGATFMTLYNTVGNLGGTWPTAIALWLVDPLTVKNCSPVLSNSIVESINATLGTNGTSDGEIYNRKETLPDKCSTAFDGYYTETIACIILGFLWFAWGNKTIKKLQMKPDTAWRLENNTSFSSNNKNKEVTTTTTNGVGLGGSNTNPEMGKE